VCHRPPLPPLPANAEQVASEIGVLPLVHRVRALASACGPPPNISFEELALWQQITEAVLAASLDVDGVAAEIDYERAQILELRARLSSAKDRKVNTLTLAGIIIGAGAGTVGTAMQFSNSAARAGDWIQSFCLFSPCASKAGKACWESRPTCWRPCSDANRSYAVSTLKMFGHT
jgi:hypothetical protein